MDGCRLTWHRGFCVGSVGCDNVGLCRGVILSMTLTVGIVVGYDRRMTKRRWKRTKH